jgi:glyoxylate/hydroxypyruvate reductase
MAILIAANFSADEWAAWMPHLQAALPGETLLRERGGAVPDAEIDIALVANPPVGSLAGLPRLALIQSLWAGVDRLLADPTVPPGVPLARMVDPAMNESMAETALWAVLSLQRSFFGYAAQQREAVWRERPWRRADEFRVAVLGLGQMGAAAARRLAANGYAVEGWQRAPRGAAGAIEGVTCHAGTAALSPLLARADAVVNLLPLTDATRGLLGAPTFAQMRRGASLVNLARGGHVVEADLLAALEAGQLRHAVLDVFATEPLPAAHPFWSHPAVTVLPHVAAETDPRSAAVIAAGNVRAVREGRALRFVVDRSRGY